MKASYTPKYKIGQKVILLYGNKAYSNARIFGFTLEVSCNKENFNPDNPESTEKYYYNVAYKDNRESKLIIVSSDSIFANTSDLIKRLET